MYERAEKDGKALTAMQVRAALMVAEDEQTDEAISADLGITSRTLRNWKNGRAFQAAVAEHRIRLEASISRFSIAKRRRRVEALQMLLDKQISVIEQRATDPRMAEAPGGETGLMTHSVKVVGYGDSAEVVDVFTVDTALMAEIRNTMKQAAQEVGQWTEKQEISKDGEELTQIIFTLPVKGSTPPIYVDGPSPE